MVLVKFQIEKDTFDYCLSDNLLNICIRYVMNNKHYDVAFHLQKKHKSKTKRCQKRGEKKTHSLLLIAFYPHPFRSAFYPYIRSVHPLCPLPHSNLIVLCFTITSLIDH
jgi:hypothetical protein